MSAEISHQSPFENLSPRYFDLQSIAKAIQARPRVPCGENAPKDPFLAVTDVDVPNPRHIIEPALNWRIGSGESWIHQSLLIVGPAAFDFPSLLRGPSDRIL